MSIYNYEIKLYNTIKHFINDKKLEKKLRYCINTYADFEINNTIYNRHDIVKLYAYLLSYKGFDKIKKENLKEYQKKYRTLVKVKKILNNEFDSFFLTLTLNEEYIDKEIKAIRRRVNRFLKSNSIDYIANFDYGKKNKRLHIHAVINTDKDLKAWPYGFYNYKYISKPNNEALSKYITKLSLHAVKDTTSLNIITNRQKKQNNVII